MRNVSTDERRAALVARQHLARTAPDPATAIRDLVAMHSSDPLTPHLGLWARVSGYHTEALDEAMPHELWRLHAMRRTLWVVESGETSMFAASVGHSIAAKERKRLLGWLERPDAAAWLDALTRLALDVITETPGIPTRQLTDRVPELSTKIRVGSGKWATEVAIASRLLFVLAMELRIARTASTGTWKGSQYGWRLAPAVREVDPATARMQLIRRYLDRFGPVTTTDLRWWTGLTAARVRGALAALKAEEVGLDEGTGWMLPGRTLGAGVGVALLPGLDPTPMGYKQRSWFLGEHEGQLFDRNGNVGPTIWVDGRVVGGWAVDDEAVVRLRFLEPVSGDARAAAEAEAAALTRWLDGVSVTPRFRTPLEKALARGSAGK